MTRPNPKRISRRLFIGAVFAAGAAAALPRQAVAGNVRRWRGQALGAHATIQLAGVSDTQAGSVFAAVEAEIRRLEAIFSLYRPDSALMRLNRDGALEAPPQELLEVLALSRAAHRETDGLFDPSVQPLFALFAEHFSAADAPAGGPSAEAIGRVLERVGFEAVRFDTGRIEFARPGMALTLNGIAQGYVTDRVGALLAREGFSNMLLDIGEISAHGGGLDGQGWRIGIAQAPERLVLADKAVATSALGGTVLDRGGRIGHIFHPKRGPIVVDSRPVTVVDDSAARADALSTAAALMDDSQRQALTARGVTLYG